MVKKGGFHLIRMSQETCEGNPIKTEYGYAHFTANAYRDSRLIEQLFRRFLTQQGTEAQ